MVLIYKYITRRLFQTLRCYPPVLGVPFNKWAWGIYESPCHNLNQAYPAGNRRNPEKRDE